MAVGIGGGPELLKLANPAGHQKLKELAERWGVQSILSSIQILDESLVRMRTSVSANSLLEVALVQICQLSNLASIPALLDAVMGGVGKRPTSPPAPPIAKDQSGKIADSEKKNAKTDQVFPTVAAAKPTSENRLPGVASVKMPLQVPVASNHPALDGCSGVASLPPVGSEATLRPREQTGGDSQPSIKQPLKPESSVGTGLGASTDAMQQWHAAIKSLDDILEDYAGLAAAIVPKGSDHWEVVFPPGATRPREICEQSEKRTALEQVVGQTVGRRVRLSFTVKPGEIPRPAATVQPSNNRVQKLREVSNNPFVKKLCEIMDGEILRVDPPAQLQSPTAAKALSTNQNL